MALSVSSANDGHMWANDENELGSRREVRPPLDRTSPAVDGLKVASVTLDRHDVTTRLEVREERSFVVRTDIAQRTVESKQLGALAVTHPRTSRVASIRSSVHVIRVGHPLSVPEQCGARRGKTTGPRHGDNRLLHHTDLTKRSTHR